MLGQQIGRHVVLAREIAQREQPLLDLLQPFRRQVGIAQQPLQRRRRFHQLAAGAIQRGDHGRNQIAGLVGDAVEPPLRAAQAMVGAVTAGEIVQRRGQRLQQLLAVHQQPALLAQLRFLAGLRLDRRQFADGVAQEFLVTPRLQDLRLQLGARGAGLPPAAPELRQLRRLAFEDAEGIQERPMIARVQQALLLELAFDLHQEFAAAAQQRDADRLIVDEGAAAAVGGDLPAQDQRRGFVDALFAQQRKDRMILPLGRTRR